MLEDIPYKSAALVYGSILNLNAIVLLFAICLPDDEEVDDGENSDGAERAQDGEEDASTTEEHSEQQEEPSSNFVALDDSFRNPNEHNDKWFPCCCSRFSYPCFFILTVLLSTMVSFEAFPRWYLQTVVHFPGWESVIFLISHGALLLSSLIYLVQRGHLGRNIGFWCSFCSNGGGDTSREETLLQIRSGRAPRRADMLVCGILGATCFTLAGLRYRSVKTNLYDVKSFSDSIGSVYAGEAHVTGFTLLDFVDDDDDAWCSSVDASILVNVTVAWGGSWGCPNSGAYCESEATTEVSCIFEGDITDPQTAYDYVNYRYHEYHGGDDDAYDEYAFDYDQDTKPQYTSGIWNRRSEFIHGDCDTCEAKSSWWLMEQADLVSSNLHFGAILIGMGLVFIGWPLMASFALHDQADVGQREEMGVELP
jgi:hypothetical protein